MGLRGAVARGFGCLWVSWLTCVGRRQWEVVDQPLAIWHERRETEKDLERERVREGGRNWERERWCWGEGGQREGKARQWLARESAVGGSRRRRGRWEKRESVGGVLMWHSMSGPFKDVLKIVNWPPKFLKFNSSPNLSFQIFKWVPNFSDFFQNCPNLSFQKFLISNFTLFKMWGFTLNAIIKGLFLT